MSTGMRWFIWSGVILFSLNAGILFSDGYFVDGYLILVFCVTLLRIVWPAGNTRDQG